MKKAVISVLAVLLLFGAPVTYAAFQTKNIEVAYGVNDMKINGVSKMPKEKPFIYNGTTYVPVRYISEQLGYPVKWIGESQTILIGQTGEENAVYPGNGIKYMNYQSGYGYNDFTYDSEGHVTDNTGNEYNKYIKMSLNQYAYHSDGEDWNYLEFPLNGKYESFKATVGLTDKYKSSTRIAQLNIYADDKQIYSGEYKAGDMPKDINLDVKNAIKLKIELRGVSNNNSSYGSYYELGLFNARFIKN